MPNSPIDTDPAQGFYNAMQRPPVPAKTACPMCGRGNSPDAEFCVACGENLAPTRTPPPREPGFEGNARNVGLVVFGVFYHPGLILLFLMLADAMFASESILLLPAIIAFLLFPIASSLYILIGEHARQRYHLAARWMYVLGMMWVPALFGWVILMIGTWGC